ncbi:uncharacterized protein C8Q71DRAFT_909533, partial [Rhodofomes roseus]
MASLVIENPRLQTEFLEFLQQKLSNVESQLSDSEKDKVQLRTALVQVEDELAGTRSALEEVRRNKVENTFLQRSELLATTERHLADAKAKLQSMEAEREQTRDKIKRLQRHKDTELEVLRNEVTKLKEAAELQETQSSQTLNDLQGQLSAAQTAFEEAVTARNAAVAAGAEKQELINEMSNKLSNAQQFVLLRDKLLGSPAPENMANHLPCPVPSGILWPKVFIRMMKFRETEQSAASPAPWYSLRLRDKHLVPLRNSHHALTVDPMHRYESSVRDRKFTSYPSGSQPRRDGRYEVFHEHGGKIYYMGTFLPLGSLQNVELDHMQLDSYCAHGSAVLVSWLAQETAGSAPSGNAVRTALPEMYRKGFMRLNVTGLQCVGFN